MSNNEMPHEGHDQHLGALHEEGSITLARHHPPLGVRNSLIPVGMDPKIYLR
jgi:hypothetical protein